MNLELKMELLAMQEEDQTLLNKLIETGCLPENQYHPAIKKLHERNTSKLKNIVERHGWPTISLVGKEASNAAWLIAQHAILDEEFMNKCLELLEISVTNNDAEAWCFAYLKDRTLTMTGQPQIYGTQFDEKDGKLTPFPIKNPEVVDDLRKELGLDTIAEAAERIRQRYKR